MTKKSDHKKKRDKAMKASLAASEARKGKDLSEAHKQVWARTKGESARERWEFYSSQAPLTSFYYLQPKETFMGFIISMVNEQPVYSCCSHFKIGSSQLQSLLRGNHNLEDSHRFFNSSQNRAYGKWAELAAQQLYPGGKKECKILKCLPFICATPDI